MLDLEPGEHLRNPCCDLTHASDFTSNDQMLQDLWNGRIKSYSLEKRYVKRSGAELWVRVTAAMVRSPDGEPVCSVGFLEDISAQKHMQMEVERVQKALIDASRQAGMAEVATNVLHNVGTCSQHQCSAVSPERLKQPGVAERSGDAVAQHSADLPEFVRGDPRGQKLPQYLTALATHLQVERDSLLKEMSDLRANLDHIKEAVTMQQAYARRCGVLEKVAVVDLIEDSLRMNTGALTRHHVELKREFTPCPDITVDKHKVLQILVNRSEMLNMMR